MKQEKNVRRKGKKVRRKGNKIREEKTNDVMLLKIKY
jgi:hypothetical protein